VRLVGLTGDIGAGKSTVALLLAQRGAVIIDADQIARDVVEPGSPVLAAIVARFGEGVLCPDGTLDRPALGRIVFGDEKARKDLEAITLPPIGAELRRRAEEHAGSNQVVVLDVPLLTSKEHYGLDDMVVVTAPKGERVRRLVKDREMAEGDARARIAAQEHLAGRDAKADVVIDNSGPPSDLEQQVDQLWARLSS
jgi:dephospho-CoA kinase